MGVTFLLIGLGVKPIGVGLIVGLMASMVIAQPHSSRDVQKLRPATGPSILIEEPVYRIYDAANGHPTADSLQHDYLDAGSEGLIQFAKLRYISGTTIAEHLARHPEIYFECEALRS